MKGGGRASSIRPSFYIARGTDTAPSRVRTASRISRTLHHPYVRKTMRLPSLPVRAAALAVALPLLAAACDEGGSGPDRLAPGDVAGVYNLCELRFTPTNAILPAADLMQAVVDTTPPAGRPEATVSVAASGVYDLVYTRQSDAFLRQMQGSVSYGATTVTLNLPGTSAVADELLLPRPLTLTLVDGPNRQLASQTQFSYTVTREDYARARNASPAGLAPTIAGNASIVLSTAPCS